MEKNETINELNRVKKSTRVEAYVWLAVTVIWLAVCAFGLCIGRYIDAMLCVIIASVTAYCCASAFVHIESCKVLIDSIEIMDYQKEKITLLNALIKVYRKEENNDKKRSN